MKAKLGVVTVLLLLLSSFWNTCIANTDAAIISESNYEQKQSINLPSVPIPSTLSSPEKAAAAMGARAGARGATADWTLGVVGAGGALGASSRYLISLWAGTVDWFGYDLPMGTLMVNVIGSLGIGVMTGWANVSEEINPVWPALITVGFLGGLTTFSTFSQETVNLAEHAGLIASAAYIGA